MTAVARAPGPGVSTSRQSGPVATVHPSAPLVSVVIATHNRWALLQEAVGSILAQSFRDFELIVVDDGSTDETAQAEVRFPSVRLVHQEHLERSVARNRGIREARGEYVAFLDDDDLYEPWHLAQFAEARRKAPGAPVFASQAWLWDHTTDRRRLLPGFDPSTLHRDVLTGTVIPLQGLVVARTVLVEVGGFPESLDRYGCEDWVLLVRVARRFPVQPLPRPSVRIREHPGRSMRDVCSISQSCEAAARLMLDEQLLGHDRQSESLLVAGMHRLIAAHHYGAGDMRGARARIREARRVLGWRRGVCLTGRLWLQTWSGPTGSRLLRRIKDRVTWHRG